MKASHHKHNRNPKIISFARYYRAMAVSALIGGIVWIACYIAETQLPRLTENHSLSILSAAAFFGLMIVLFLNQTRMITLIAMRDKEDELYLENKAKTNKLFLTILYYMALPMIGFGAFFSGVRFTFSYFLTAGFIWLMLSLYYFIALHYEKSGICEDDM